MRQISNLFVLAGYTGDLNRPIASIKSLNTLGDTSDSIGRTYPTNIGKQQAYIKDIAKILMDYIFDPDPSTAFCRNFDQPCMVDSEKGRGKTCIKPGGPTACFRARPKMIVIVAHPRVWDELFKTLGRAVLLIKYDKEDLSDLESLKDFISNSKPHINAAKEFLYTIPPSILAPIMPLNNFQVKSGHKISEDVQRNIADLPKTLKDYHAILYDAKFSNYVKKYMKGGYRLTDKVAFQRDKLHNFAQLGQSSRDNVFHLINAHHFYGAHFPIGTHFDVTEDSGGALHEVFQDILTGSPSSGSSKHENITPCDRVL